MTFHSRLQMQWRHALEELSTGLTDLLSFNSFDGDEKACLLVNKRSSLGT